MKEIYLALILVEILWSLLNIWQFENEDLLLYLEIFKSKLNILLNIFGSGILDGFFENSRDNIVLPMGDTNAQKSMKHKVGDIVLDIIFVCGLDQGQCG